MQRILCSWFYVMFLILIFYNDKIVQFNISNLGENLDIIEKV